MDVSPVRSVRLYPLPSNEPSRLASLNRLIEEGIIDAAAEEGTLQRVAETARLALRVPMAFVNLIEDEAQRCLAGVGPTFDGSLRATSFCTHLLVDLEPMVVEDATLDPRFQRNLLVQGAPGLRAYAGVPLVLRDGTALGALCVLDTKPRSFDDHAIRTLEYLAGFAVDAIEGHRRTLREARRTTEHRVLFDRHPQPMWVFDAESYRLLTVNDAALKTYGYTRDEMLACTLFDLRPTEEHTELSARLATLNGTRATSGPWTHQRKDGSLLHVQVESTPVTFGGRPARLARITDVTEVVRARAQTEAAAARALDLVDDVLLELDAERRIVRWNAATKAAFGRSAEEIRGSRIESLFVASDQRAAAAAFGPGGGAPFAGTVVRRDGQRARFEFVSAAMPDARGELRYSVFGRDMSERARRETLRSGEVAILSALAEGAAIDEVLTRVVRLVEALFDGAHASLHRYDASSNRLVLSVAPSLPASLRDAASDIEPGPNQGSCGTAAFLGESVFVSDVQRDPRWEGIGEAVLAHGYRACWSTPVRGRNRALLGTLAVYHKDVRSSTPADLETINGAVHLAAVALEHAAALKALIDRDRLMAGTTEALRTLFLSEEPDHGMERALGMLGHAVEASRVYLFEQHAHPENGQRAVSQRAEWAREDAESFKDDPFMQNLLPDDYFPGWLDQLEAGCEVTADIATLNAPGQDLLLVQDIVSLMLVPVRVGGEHWGFLGFDDCERSRTWPQSERDAMRAVAAALGAAFNTFRAARAIRAAHARFEAVAASAPGIVFQCSVDAEGRLGFPYFSRRGAEWIGLDPEMLREPSLLITTRIDPVDLPSFRASVARAVADEAGWSWEGRLRNAEGEFRWVTCTSAPARDESGGLIWNGIVLDITEARLAAEALRYSEEQFRRLADAMPQLVWTTNGNGRATYFNARLAAYAWRGDELSFGALLPEAELERLEGLWDQAVEERSTFQAEHLICLADGSQRWHLTRAVPQFNPDGSIAHWFGTTTDVHDLKEALAESRKAERLKSALLTNMSHEIRTPLTAMIGFADLLADEVQGDHAEMVHHIAVGGRRLLDTLNAVLDLAQLESGLHPVTVQPVEVTALAEGVAAQFREAAEAKGLRLACAPADKLTVQTDAAAVRRILSSLVSNAVKFTDTGYVTLAVVAEDEETVFSVSDTGIGIRASFLPDLFRGFVQESDGLTREFEGTGLNLAVAYRLAQQIGGELTVHSSKGAGSTFVLRLPRAV